MAFLGEYGFNNFFDFFGFMTNICYILMPLLFNMLIEYGSFEIESISITSVMAMYFNAFTYFFLGFFEQNNGKIILLRDYSNLIGTFLGLVYLTLYFYERYIIEVKILILYSVLVLLGTGIIALLEYFFIVEKSNDAYDKIFKWLGVIPNVMEYLPIGYNIFHLIRDRKSKKFLIIGGTFGIFNACFWLAWAITQTCAEKDDPQYHAICANFLALCLLGGEIYIFFRYKKEERESYLYKKLE